MARMERLGGGRNLIHIIDPCFKHRAELARIVVALGYHSEIYDDLSDLSAHPPRDGIIILRDLSGEEGVSLLAERLADLGVWLPIILAGEVPNAATVVDAVKAGAFDYLVLPIVPDALGKSLARVAAEAEQVKAAKRDAIRARRLIAALSNRELEVLRGMSHGDSSKAIATQLNISFRTVELYRANMLSKLGVRNSIEAIHLALQVENVASN